MASAQNENVISSFILGEYEELVGVWNVGSSGTSHSSLVDAKRYCLKLGNCFGISVDPNGNVFAGTFPVYMRTGGKFRILLRKTSFGIYIYTKNLNCFWI